MASKTELVHERGLKILADSLGHAQKLLAQAEAYRRSLGASFKNAFETAANRRRHELDFLKPVLEAAMEIAAAQDQEKCLSDVPRGVSERIAIANRHCHILRARWELGLASAARTESESRKCIQRAQEHLKRGAIEGIEAEWLDAGYYEEDIEAICHKAQRREIRDHLNEAAHLLNFSRRLGRNPLESAAHLACLNQLMLAAGLSFDIRSDTETNVRARAALHHVREAWASLMHADFSLADRNKLLFEAKDLADKALSRIMPYIDAAAE